MPRDLGPSGSSPRRGADPGRQAPTREATFAWEAASARQATFAWEAGSAREASFAWEAGSAWQATFARGRSD